MQEALHERSRKEESDEEKLLYERQKTTSTKRKLGKKQKSITEKKSFQKGKFHCLFFNRELLFWAPNNENK